MKLWKLSDNKFYDADNGILYQIPKNDPLVMEIMSPADGYIKISGSEAAMLHHHLVENAGICEMASVQKIYEKYAYIDDLLSDELWLPDNMIGYILYDLWQAIRDSVKRATEKKRDE